MSNHKQHYFQFIKYHVLNQSNTQKITFYPFFFFIFHISMPFEFNLKSQSFLIYSESVSIHFPKALFIITATSDTTDAPMDTTGISTATIVHRDKKDGFPMSPRTLYKYTSIKKALLNSEIVLSNLDLFGFPLSQFLESVPPMLVWPELLRSHSTTISVVFAFLHVLLFFTWILVIISNRWMTLSRSLSFHKWLISHFSSFSAVLAAAFMQWEDTYFLVSGLCHKFIWIR